LVGIQWVWWWVVGGGWAGLGWAGLGWAGVWWWAWEGLFECIHEGHERQVAAVNGHMNVAFAWPPLQPHQPGQQPMACMLWHGPEPRTWPP
jgi:hypothetical protein